MITDDEIDLKVKSYIDDVLSGKILACKQVKLCVERHVNDLTREDYKDRFFYDIEAARDVIRFVHLLKHVEGKLAGKYIILEPWQCFIFAVLFGWKRADGSRRFRTAYVEIGRKNGKSSLCAGIGLYTFLCDGELGAQVYTAATKRSQAAIVHSISKRMVQMDKQLKSVITVLREDMLIKSNGSKYVPLGADSDTEDGLNVHCAIVDEYHAHKNDALFNVLRSAMGARRQPLIVIITTAGFDLASPCYSERTYAENVLKRTFDDPSYFGIIYTLDEHDQWDDETVWIKANPNLGVSVDLDDMRDMLCKAKEAPLKRSEFMTKKLNMWLNGSQEWLNIAYWENCNSGIVDRERLKGRKCYGAFDLSMVSDLSVWTLCFPPEREDDRFIFLHKFFIPRGNLQEKIRKDRVPYDQWIESGHVIATPGDLVDYAFVEQIIKDDAKFFEIQEIAYDPYNATDLATRLQEDGLELVQFGQGYRSISPAAKDFEAKMIREEMEHGQNPVMTFCVQCVEIDIDPNANIKPRKPDRNKSSKRIDGVITSLMALDRAVRALREEDSVYSSRGIISFNL